MRFKGNCLKLNISTWFLQESNQGHTDFQSVALPTELRNLFCFITVLKWCKSKHFIYMTQVFSKEFYIFF